MNIARTVRQPHPRVTTSDYLRQLRARTERHIIAAAVRGPGVAMDEGSLRELKFVPLQSAALCVDCEVITESHEGQCRICGGRALLGLDRLLGGPIGPERAQLLDPAEAEVNRLVRKLIESAYEIEEDPDEEAAL